MSELEEGVCRGLADRVETLSIRSSTSDELAATVNGREVRFEVIRESGPSVRLEASGPRIKNGPITQNPEDSLRRALLEFSWGQVLSEIES